MAFFKFPWFNQSQAPDKGSSRRGRAAQAESVEELRRRARQRLIGAVVLVLAGVIVFPMVFDTQPRTVPVKVVIDIPDRNTAGALVIGAAPATTADAAKQAVGAGLADGEEQVPAKPVAAAAPAAASPPAAPAESAEAKAPAKAEPKLDIRPEPKPVPKAEPKAEPKTEPKHAVAPTPVPTPAPSSDADAARARALLEGKNGGAVAATPAATAQAERFIVQVGAYADQAKVREVRARLERAGLKTYAQDIQGKEGVRTTRVRLGPFANRAEAAKVLDRIKGLGLDGAILTL